ISSGLGAGCILCGLSGLTGANSYDGFSLEAKTFGSEGWKPVTPSVRGKVINGYGLPIRIAEIEQALKENGEDREVAKRRYMAPAILDVAPGSLNRAPLSLPFGRTAQEQS